MIVITEKEVNRKTGIKTKKTVKTDFMSDWLNALNEWVELHCNNDSIVTTTVCDTKKKMKIGFTTMVGDFRYRLTVEWC